MQMWHDLYLFPNKKSNFGPRRFGRKSFGVRKCPLENARLHESHFKFLPFICNLSLCPNHIKYKCYQLGAPLKALFLHTRRLYNIFYFILSKTSHLMWNDNVKQKTINLLTHCYFYYSILLHQ